MPKIGRGGSVSEYNLSCKKAGSEPSNSFDIFSKISVFTARSFTPAVGLLVCFNKYLSAIKLLTLVNAQRKGS